MSLSFDLVFQCRWCVCVCVCDLTRASRSRPSQFGTAGLHSGPGQRPRFGITRTGRQPMIEISCRRWLVSSSYCIVRRSFGVGRGCSHSSNREIGLVSCICVCVCMGACRRATVVCVKPGWDVLLLVQLRLLLRLLWPCPQPWARRWAWPWARPWVWPWVRPWAPSPRNLPILLDGPCEDSGDHIASLFEPSRRQADDSVAFVATLLRNLAGIRRAEENAKRG
jgi:hypothetical protein